MIVIFFLIQNEIVSLVSFAEHDGVDSCNRIYLAVGEKFLLIDTYCDVGNSG